MKKLSDLKKGDQITIYCTALLVEATITAITENSLTAKHEAVQWGNDTYTITHSSQVQSFTGQPQKMIPHCFKDGEQIYA